MAFLSTNNLRANLQNWINPYDETKIKSGSYELSLGGEYYSTDSEDGRKKLLVEGEQMKIAPGQFAILLSEEKVAIPSHVLAFISIKAGIKFKGLVNVSGFHVDPGFKGRLKFAVYNAGSKDLILQRMQPIFQIWFCKFTEALSATDIYSGEHQNQNDISAEDVMKIQGDVASPSVLNERIKNNHEELKKQISGINKELEFKKTLYIGIWFLLASIILTFTLPIAYNAIYPEKIEPKKDNEPKIIIINPNGSTNEIKLYPDSTNQRK